MNEKEVKEKLTKACRSLYDKELGLIRNCTHERTIASQIARYLEPLFEGWNVDIEYNREGSEEKPKRSIDGELLLPDIVIHKRGSKMGPNLVTVQVKGFWNKEDRTKDEEDLRKLWSKYKYKFLYRLELKPKSFKLIPVNPES